jgi:hypothetical protein
MGEKRDMAWRWGDLGTVFNSGQSAAIFVNAPYLPGDRLWVRETWGIFDCDTFGEEYGIAYKADESGDDGAPCRWIKTPVEWRGRYCCIDEIEGTCLSDERWRSSIHMPRWVSRLTLEIKDVRVERLKDISEEDALQEGVVSHPVWKRFAISEFEKLWDPLNAKHGWDVNPWVWVIEFQRCDEQEN